MTLRAALRATMALVAVSLASALPADAQTVTPPGGAVFGIGAGATSVSAAVVMTMPNGTKIPIGVLNPTTGAFAPSGLGAVQTTAAQALSAAQSSLQPGNALSELVAVSAAARTNLGLGTAATLPVGSGGVASYGDNRIPSPNATGDQQITGPDGATLGVVNVLPAFYGAVEALHFVPGNTNAGATLLCQHSGDSLLSQSVSCNIVMSGEGRFRTGGGDGLYLEVLPPGAPVASAVQMTPGTTANFAGVTYGCLPITQSSCVINITPTGSAGIAIGQGSQSTQQGAIAAGFNTTIFGNPFSFYSGHYASDRSGRGPSGGRCHQSSWVAVGSGAFTGGGNQDCSQTLATTITNATAAQLTVDGTSNVSAIRSVPVEPNGHGTFDAAIECSNLTSGDAAVWLFRGSFSRVVNTMRFPYLPAGYGTSLSGSTAAGGMGTMTLALTPNTTNGNFQFQATPPSGNTATISCDGRVYYMQRIG